MTILTALLSAWVAYVNASGVPESTPAPDRNGQLTQLCDREGRMSGCLSLLLAYRCEQYAALLPTARKFECQRAAALTLKELEPTFVPISIEAEGDGRAHVIFPRELRSLLRDARARGFLVALRDALIEKSHRGDSFSLWDFTLKHAQGDSLLALRWIAVFLQDTSWVQSPLVFLRKELKARDEAYAQSLGVLQELLGMLQDRALLQSDYRDWLSLYPRVNGKSLDGELNPSLYHFYPMAYLAQTLLRKGVRREMAFFVPFLFNADYEFKDIDPSSWPFRHPRPFSSDNLWKMQDLYAGFTGALYGVGKAAPGFGLEPFSKAIAADPFGFMRAWFQRKF